MGSARTPGRRAPRGRSLRLALPRRYCTDCIGCSLHRGWKLAGWRLTPAATRRPASSVMRQARGSKRREAQRIKPGLALLLLAVEVERIAAAGLDVARDPGVEIGRASCR